MADALWLCDDLGARRETFAIGETVFVSGRGLSPTAAYSFSLADDDADAPAALIARCLSDRHGALPTTALIPYLGLVPSAGGDTRSHVEARESVRGGLVRVAADHRRKAAANLRFEVDRDHPSPRLFPCDRHGRLRSGVVHGADEIALFLRNFPPECLRIFVVPRQFGWRLGDPIEAAAVHTFAHDGAGAVVDLGRADRFAPGSYQFIARAFRPGWYAADEPALLIDDVVSDRNFASLVIRRPFGPRFGFANGVVLTPQIAGRPLAHRPYFRFEDNFPLGTDVYAALDPDALPAGLVGQRAAIYVIAHKSSAQWTASSALADITGPGMTPAPKVVPIVPGCVNWNRTLVWPNPQTTGSYDIVIDFGNNAPDPANFVTDGTLDPPLDMIDGYVRVGFRVTADPSLPGPFAGHIGQHDYNAGTIQVPNTDTGPTPTDSLPLTATIRYPSTASGIDAPFAAGAFPLFVMMHGNSGYDTSYLGYDYLLDHLAGHGFVAMSIYAPVGVMIETRARAILAHLGIMAQNNADPGLFQGHIDFANVGIGGHSRGGEAVVRAARINTAEGLGWNIRAGASIAPTDYHHYAGPGVPLMVIYGANDGDVAGTWPDRTGFNIYDEAGRPRSFVFVYGATHDQFNTVWAPTFLSVESDIAPGDVAQLISLGDHENVAKGYITAFLQAHLQGQDEQLAYLSDGLKPSLVAGLQIHTSHQVSAGLTVDDFEGGNPGLNRLGGPVTDASLAALSENALHALDIHSPHITKGADIAWTSTAGVYVSQVPATDADVSAFTAFSFRVTQKYASPRNPANQPADLFVRLTDGSGRSRAINAGIFTDIPYPYVRGYADLIKSAMKSVRMPLASWAIANLGAQDVDLADVRSVGFEFSIDLTGEIEIDDIEFSP
ncbi:MAG: alpha/beta hydrolase family protein [Caulobacteraceae bacterium]